MIFKVIKIVDEYMIVVDYGLKNNARVGDTLEIINTGVDILDPDNNYKLGTLDLIKGEVRVKHTYPNFSLCISNEKVTITNPNIGNFSEAIHSFSRNFSTTEMKALNVNTTQISGGYDKDTDLVINIGDPVKVKEASEFDIKEDN